MKIPFVPSAWLDAARTLGLRAWQIGPLLRKAFQSAIDSVQEVLRAEVQKGNAKLVADFLLDKAAPAVRAVLLDKMTAKLTARLLAKLGLRGILASNVAGWVLPIVVEKAVKLVLQTEAAARLQEHPTVKNVRQTLDELKRKLRRAVAPDFGSGAELFEGQEPPQLKA